MSLDYQRLERVLAEAAAKSDPAERAAFLDQECGEDRELRTEVERLLAAHEKAGDFLDTPFQPVPEPNSGKTESDIAIERSGAMIGRYKLLEEIGEGAFGVVYMAEQLEPVHRCVALKVIKAGMDTKEVVARFEAERQALALMDHPHIAQVFDGGATQTGRPYFVMELVRGIAITEFCDQRKSSTKERLQLFVQVCHAVQHAHQKGIIHRDLKPSNILVTLIDGEAVPKIIDFGVAKALGRKLTEKTLFTGFLKMVGTPAYMSPEQADLSGVDIDTRADIYALGVLLYELLIGVTPFDTETLRRAALDEVRRMIRETEPPKPSTRLQTLGARLAEVAKYRQTEPATLNRLVRGDLDRVVMKCLEKDRGRRYETANSLADDIERHLGNEPVVARPPSRLYRFRKSVRRNKLTFAAIGAVVAALIAGLSISTWLFVQERQARERAVVAEARAERNRQRAEASGRKARTEAALSAQVARFMKDMLKGVGPGVAQGRDTTLLREILDQTAERIGKELTNQPAVELELRNTIGDAYWELGQYESAESSYRRALELTRKLYKSDDPVLADMLHNVAEYLRRFDKRPEAIRMEREALSIYRNRFGDEHPKVGDSLNNLFFMLATLGRHAEGESLGRQALAMNERLLGKEHPVVGRTLSRLGVVLEYEGMLEESEAMQRRGLAIHRKALAKEYLDREQRVELPWSLYHLARVLREQGKLADAERFAREALSTRRTLEGANHPDIGFDAGLLACVLLERGKSVEAEQLVHRLMAAPGTNAEILAALAWWLATCTDSAARDGQIALDCVKPAVAKTGRTNAMCLDALAAAYAEVGQFADAINTQKEAVALVTTEEEKNDYSSRLTLYRERIPYRKHRALGARVATLLAQGKFGDAECMARECLVLRERLIPDNWLAFNARSLLGGSLLGQKKYAEAEPLLTSGYEGMKQRENQILAQYRRLRLKEALQRLVQLYEATGQSEKASAWRQRLSETDKPAASNQAGTR